MTPTPRSHTLRFDLPIVVMVVNDRSHMALTKVGGMDVRGEVAGTPVAAVQGLFQQLAQPHHGNAVMGIEMALSGESLEDVFALPDQPANTPALTAAEREARFGLPDIGEDVEGDEDPEPPRRRIVDRPQA